MTRTSSYLFNILKLMLLFISCSSGFAEGAAIDYPNLRVGIIGLDTSHAIHFTKELNDPDAKPDIAGCPVVAAYPKGSPDIESSVSRVPKYTAEMQEMGVEIVLSIAALLEKVDCVLLETNDGRPHLEQALQVIKAGKPLFIDKPIAGSLRDAVAIFAAARQANVPVFSSSSLRFGADTEAARNGSLGTITNCETHSPCHLEATHPDLFWYGIHGVESLFAVMGTGCQTVARRTEQGKIVVEGIWPDGRIGIFREGSSYGGFAKGSQGEAEVGTYGGYRPLVVEIVKFFRTGVPPVGAEETLDIYAFMEAADESQRQGGKAIQLQDVLDQATQNSEAGFRSLTDQNSAKQWSDGVEIRDGIMQGRGWYKQEFSDFHLKFDFRLNHGSNSGIGIRSTIGGNPAYEGMEIQVLDDTAPRYANIKPWQFHGSIYGVVPAKPGHLKPVGEWNSEEIIARGNHIVVRLNGTTIVDAKIDEAAADGTIDGNDHPGLFNRSGYIAILGHGAEGDVEFRNMRINDLSKSATSNLSIRWKDRFLTIAGSQIPGDKLDINYIEAYCRAGSTDRYWGDTVIKHKTELLDASDDQRQIRLRD